MKAPGNISATCMGAKAERLLAGEPEGKVWGATSRGVFIYLESDWVIYLSREDVPGPLTLNLEGDIGQIKSAQIGDVVRISSQRIEFPRTGMQIDTARSAIWEAPPPIEICIDLDKCRLRCRDVSRMAIRQLDQTGRIPGSLFQSFLSLSGLEGHACPSDDHWSTLLASLANAREERATEKVAGCLEAFLGVGNGLTPSGDDLVVGFLLALNRWGESIATEIDIDSINPKLVSAAYAKTTTLSANLIQCAANGQANRRLIESLDGVISGIPDAQQCAALLASWGNSSGVDALAGMGIAIGYNEIP